MHTWYVREETKDGLLFEISNTMGDKESWTWATPFLYFQSFLFFWSIVDLQCCVSFRCIAKWMYMYMYIYSLFLKILFPYTAILLIKALLLVFHPPTN